MSRSDEQPITAEPRAKDGRGGARPGAGRKRRGIFAVLQGDKDYARNLVSLLMRDHSQPIDLRARCALAILLKGESRGGGGAPTVYLGEPPIIPAGGNPATRGETGLS